MKRIIVIIAALALCLQGFCQPRLVAHRGGRYEADENTLPAFSTALKAGITGYELDVHRTADGHYVIMHDEDISRMVNAAGIIEKMKFKDLRALRTKKGNKIPTLDEVLALFGKYEGLYVEFEMKTSREDLYTPEILEIYARDVYKAITEACPKGSLYLFSSFDTRVLKLLHGSHPDATLMLITGKGMSEELRAIAAEVGTKRVACHRTRTTLEEMNKAHKEGFIVNLWPNGTVEDVVLSNALGADFICTDTPREISRLIEEGRFNIKK